MCPTEITGTTYALSQWLEQYAYPPASPVTMRLVCWQADRGETCGWMISNLFRHAVALIAVLTHNVPSSHQARDLSIPTISASFSAIFCCSASVSLAIDFLTLFAKMARRRACVFRSSMACSSFMSGKATVGLVDWLQIPRAAMCAIKARTASYLAVTRCTSSSCSVLGSQS